MNTTKFRLLVLKALHHIISAQGNYYNNGILDSLDEGIHELDKEVRDEDRPSKNRRMM